MLWRLGVQCTYGLATEEGGLFFQRRHVLVDEVAIDELVAGLEGLATEFSELLGELDGVLVGLAESINALNELEIGFVKTRGRECSNTKIVVS